MQVKPTRAIHHFPDTKQKVLRPRPIKATAQDIKDLHKPSFLSRIAKDVFILAELGYLITHPDLITAK